MVALNHISQRALNYWTYSVWLRITAENRMEPSSELAEKPFLPQMSKLVKKENVSSIWKQQILPLISVKHTFISHPLQSHDTGLQVRKSKMTARRLAQWVERASHVPRLCSGSRFPTQVPFSCHIFSCSINKAIKGQKNIKKKIKNDIRRISTKMSCLLTEFRMFQTVFSLSFYTERMKMLFRVHGGELLWLVKLEGKLLWLSKICRTAAVIGPNCNVAQNITGLGWIYVNCCNRDTATSWRDRSWIKMPTWLSHFIYIRCFSHQLDTKMTPSKMKKWFAKPFQIDFLHPVTHEDWSHPPLSPPTLFFDPSIICPSAFHPPISPLSCFIAPSFWPSSSSHEESDSISLKCHSPYSSLRCSPPPPTVSPPLLWSSYCPAGVL